MEGYIWAESYSELPSIENYRHFYWKIVALIVQNM